MVTISETLAIGVRHHQAGQFAEAERVYRQVLKVEPHNAEALHLLGTLATQARQFPAAIQLIENAIRQNPAQAVFYVSLADAHRRSGDFSKAIDCYRRVLELEPGSILAYSNLGILLHQQGNFDDAVASFREATRLRPQDAQLHANLGRVLYDQGRFDQSEQSFRQALRISPQSAQAHYNLASVLHAQVKREESLAYYHAALALQPDNADAHLNLGNLLKDRNELAGAEQHYRQAIALQPNSAAAHHNLGTLFQAQGKLDEAAASLRSAIQLEPRMVQAWNSLGGVLGSRGAIDEALEHCRRAIDLEPRFSAAYNNASHFLQSLGQLDQAIAHGRKAVELDPLDSGAHSNLLYALNYHEDYDAQTIFVEHRAWAERHADPLTQPAVEHHNEPARDRRLRIGYVSPFFRQHAVNSFIEPILGAHDHGQFEVFCFSDTTNADATTDRLRGYADHWRDTLGQTDAQLAELVRRDRIDILVDLTGHIAGGGRLLAFARTPAPIQVTYIGYQNTTGMLAMDYRLTDTYADPPGSTDRFYTERLVRLPRSYFCYLAPDAAPPVGALPCRKNGYVTFGSVNNFAKVTPSVLAAWAEILLRVPDARLLVLSHATPSLRRYILDQFRARNVDEQRIELAARGSYEHYLQVIQQIDIALDSFPFNGHTTTCDCLWMCVPVIMLAGHTYASRFGGTALVNLRLQDLIATSKDEYVEIAARLATDRDRLQELHAELRTMMSDSPLLDARGFTRDLEGAYRQMWREWCDREASATS